MALLGAVLAASVSGCGTSVEVTAATGTSSGSAQANAGKLYAPIGHLCEKLSPRLLTSLNIPAGTHDTDLYGAASSVTNELSGCDWDGSMTSGRELEVDIYEQQPSLGVSGALSQLSEDSNDQKMSLVEHGGTDVIDRHLSGIGQSAVYLYAVTSGSPGGSYSQARLNVQAENVVIEVQYTDYSQTTRTIPEATSRHDAGLAVQQVLGLLKQV
jgi:hypothetical protein